jgi:hypothetical protein
MLNDLYWYCRRCLSIALRGSLSSALNWAGIIGVGLFGAFLHYRGSNLRFEDEWYGAVASAVVYTAVAWSAIFALRLIFVAPFQLYRSQRSQADKPALEHLVRNRDSFTLAEAACLLAHTEIQQDDIVGPASSYLYDIKKRILASEVPVLNSTSHEIEYVRALSTGLALTAGAPKRELRNSLEISKGTLAKLGTEFGVKIPGIELKPS